MPTFELIEVKNPADLAIEDHIIVKDEFWRIVENYRILGSGRMLVLAYVTHVDAKSFKFHEIKTEQRISAYKRTD